MPLRTPPFPLLDQQDAAIADAVEPTATQRQLILVVDGASVTCLPLTDHLRQQGFRCEIQGTAQGTLNLLSRAAADRWPFLILIHYPPVDTDGIELLATLRQSYPSITIVCYANLNLVGGIIIDQADRMHVRFLSLPFDFNRVNNVIKASSEANERGKSRETGLFFGTSRHVRGSTSRYDTPALSATDTTPKSGTDRVAGPKDLPVDPEFADLPPPVAPVTTRLRRPDTVSDAPLAPATGSITRRGVDTGLVRREQTGTIRTGTARFANSNAPATTTSRIRRSVTGRVENPNAPGSEDDQAAPGTGSQVRVACAACGQAFAVTTRSVPFTVPCLQCGAANRIDPRS